MLLRLAKAPLMPIAATMLVIALAGCTSSTSIISKRTQGYEISDAAMQQVRVGQSQELVRVVLGSPQSTNTFGDQTAWYYVQTKVEQTSFGFNVKQERTVLAVYFDKSRKVVDKAVYSQADGKLITVESRRTASYGEDRTFIDQILQSF
jgi:outer membrane protein assembly factor BamE (lipoprotein component of BamABCDE complex)